MKISELIKGLQELKESEGDLECLSSDTEGDYLLTRVRLEPTDDLCLYDSTDIRYITTNKVVVL